MPQIGNDGCDKPRCNGDGERTYRGENGNTLSLCDQCYYNLVSGKSSESTDSGIATSIGSYDIPQATGAATRELDPSSPPTGGTDIEF